MSGDANVASLQNQLNRYAQVAGFTALGVDGIIGPLTGEGVLKALAWVTANDSDEHDTAASLAVAVVRDDGTLNLTQIQQSAYGLATYFGQIADAHSLARPSTNLYPVASNSSHNAQTVLNTANASGANAMAANLLLAVKNLPTWAKVSGGIALGLVAIAGYQHAKEHHGSLHGFFGFDAPRRRRRAYA